MSTNMLSVKNINKSIKGKSIVRNISFDIDAGQVMGFLGPNGAGKSTTLRMVVGLSRPTSGDVTINGHSVRNNYVAAMSNVGCIIEGPDLYENMTGYGNLEMLSVMGGLVDKDHLLSLAKLVGLEHRIYDKVRIYSMGMKQRLGLAAALLHDPKLLVLDEPTNGLDPQGIYEFREIIHRLASEQGISVLISSHLISEVQLMCDHVVIINQGEIIRSSDVASLLDQGTVIWHTGNPPATMALLRDQFSLEAELTPSGLQANVGDIPLAQINRAIHDAGIDLNQVAIKEKTLESLFLELTKDEEIM